MSSDWADFLATTEHRRPSRILYHAGFTDDLRKRLVEHIGTNDIAGHYGFYRSAGLSLKRPEGLPPLDFSRYWHGETLPAGTTFDGHGVAMVPSGFYHFWGYISPLRHAKSLKDIEDYPLEDVSGWGTDHLAAAVAAAHAAGKVAVGWVGHMYETAWQIRGYEQFLLDTIERPAWAECLLQRLYQQNMLRAIAFARAGADLITTGDDVASQKALIFAPDTWRRLIHSRWAEVWRTIKEIRPTTRIWYHSDGNIAAIVPELVEAGLDILNPLQPECLDVDALHKRFGDRLTFDGTIGTQSTMPWGTPEQVRARVREVIRKYGRRGGLIISPTHVLEPEVPLANIDALFAACREFGSFS
ncbi:MAG TPA: uroporphyrinogen decarboxylase family protein [Planctomycetota bacterium]|nr:uroporphyrinogen decarboxylase family protein [Planctomycetota bacterium]HRR80019.1 uroporphyrinogen decarboxylase family protein [Planctomycetota bacterium]HRT96656.1 uroporphyrinogen decarboxylase family protein [Planctomycetota bacterium]